MTEVKVTRITEIDDPKLRQFFDDLAEGLMAAGWKAAAHHAAPDQVALPAGDTLERRFLTYLRARPAAAQQKIAARGLSLVQTRKVPGLEGLDLKPAASAIDLVRSRVKLEKLSPRPTAPIKQVAPVIEDGAPGFRKLSAPTELEFLITRVKCIDETSSHEIGDDEMAIGGVMVDAAGNTVKIPQIKLGDFSKDGVTHSFNPPKPLGKLAFPGAGAWPRSYSLVLTLVELDNGGFPALLDKLFDETRKTVADAVKAAAGALFGDKLAGLIASGLDWVFGKLFDTLREAWEDDLFKPATFNFEFADAGARFAGGGQELGLWVDWKGHGGRYMTWLAAELGPIADQGRGEMFKSLGNGDIRTVAYYERWRKTWTEIVPIDGGLLFYDRNAGVGEFYRVDAQGSMTLLRQHTGWRKTWSQIVPGHFSSQGGTDLLFYDSNNGFGAFYSVQADGSMRLLREHSGWRKSWRHIVPGNFGGNGFTDLLFYDAGKGEGEFHATDGAGGMQLLARHSGWRQGWKWIVAGAFGGSGYTDLLFYDMQAGEAEFHAVDGGRMTLLRKHAGWRKTWTQAVVGSFASGDYTDLLLYDPTQGVAEVHRGTGNGELQRLRQHTGWRRSWSQMVALKFSGDAWHDLVFYDRMSSEQG